MKPLRPSGKGWEQRSVTVPDCPEAEGWYHLKDRIGIISSVDPSAEDGSDEYHLSILGVTRCSTKVAMETLNAFGMVNAVEDNVGSTNPETRHFWQPVKKERA